MKNLQPHPTFLALRSIVHAILLSCTQFIDIKVSGCGGLGRSHHQEPLLLAGSETLALH